MPAAVAFDNDGLLLGTEDAWTRAEVTLFARQGREFTLEDKRDLLGSSRAIAAGKLERLLDAPGRGEALMDELEDLVMAEAARGVEPMPGAVELVDALRAAGTPLAVVTNATRAFVELTLTGAAIRDRFDVVVCAQDVVHPKPAPDLYLAACAALRVEPSRVTGLEDSVTGVAALKAAGLFAIGVPSLPGVVLEQADLVAPSLADPAIHRALGL
jgi:HAD superfamily hydrolase (TIGR01509 family)